MKKSRGAMKFLRSSSFWSTFVAVLALVLSQLPPAKDWVHRENLKIRTSDKFRIVHAFGVLGLNMQLDLKNDGNTPIATDVIRIALIHPSGKKTELVAQIYYPHVSSGESTIAYPITSINLAPGQTWSEWVTFGQDFSPELEEKMNAIQLRVSQDIFKAGQSVQPGQWTPALQQATPESARLAVELFQKNFDLQKGEYTMTLTVFGAKGRPISTKRYRFTLYDYHVLTLQSQVDDYRYGAGIIMPFNRSKDVWVKTQEF